ncbi:hypothetical protein CW713_04350 [Methanophagales archaeon]|nr:MAG: hypothetical protein CW713_04350 [Methanophagales archaeon]
MFIICLYIYINMYVMPLCRLWDSLVTISVLNGENFIRVNREKLLQIVYPLRSQFPVKNLTKKLLLVFLLAQVFFL